LKLFLCATAEPFRSEGFVEYLKGKRLEESTIEAKLKLVKHLNTKFNLWDSDLIREYIYNAEWGGRRKNNAGYAYMDWCRWKGFDFSFERRRFLVIHCQCFLRSLGKRSVTRLSLTSCSSHDFNPARTSVKPPVESSAEFTTASPSPLKPLLVTLTKVESSL